jgi:hypothetical protein
MNKQIVQYDLLKLTKSIGDDKIDLVYNSHKIYKFSEVDWCLREIYKENFDNYNLKNFEELLYVAQNNQKLHEVIIKVIFHLLKSKPMFKQQF